MDGLVEAALLVVLLSVSVAGLIGTLRGIRDTVPVTYDDGHRTGRVQAAPSARFCSDARKEQQV